MTTEDLNTMTIDELKALKTAIMTRIGQLDPRAAFIAEVNADKLYYASEEEHGEDDYGDDYYIEWLDLNTDHTELEGDEIIAFLEELYIKQHSGETVA